MVGDPICNVAAFGLLGIPAALYAMCGSRAAPHRFLQHKMATHDRFSGSRPAAVARRAVAAFRSHFDASGEAPAVGARAPGRVNLIGGHTDYNDGFVLPATIDRTVCVVFRQRSGHTVRLWSADFEERAEYELSGDIAALPGWARYVGGVAEAFRQREGLPSGFEGVIHGDVPLGAGLSSSAALEVAAALGLARVFGRGLDPVETATMCQHVEQTYVGVDCGIMDQFAARLGQSGHALFLDCRSLDYEHVSLPADRVRLVVLDSRVRRELASSKYNEHRRACEQATRFFQQFDERITALRDVSSDLLDTHGADLPDPIRRLTRHVVTENRRVQRGAELLRAGELAAFGRLVNASHASLRDDYEVSSAELDHLAETAQSTPGVFGARMTGAGFGGCVVALAKPDAVSNLKRNIVQSYTEKFGREPAVYAIERGEEAGSFAPEAVAESA